MCEQRAIKLPIHNHIYTGVQNIYRGSYVDGEVVFVNAAMHPRVQNPTDPAQSQGDYRGKSAWIYARLEKHRSIVPMLGIGVIVKGDKKRFLRWLGLGVQRGLLAFPANAGRIEWPRANLAEIFSQQKSIEPDVIQ